MPNSFENHRFWIPNRTHQFSIDCFLHFFDLFLYSNQSLLVLTFHNDHLTYWIAISIKWCTRFKGGSQSQDLVVQYYLSQFDHCNARLPFIVSVLEIACWLEFSNCKVGLNRRWIKENIFNYESWFTNAMIIIQYKDSLPKLNIKCELFSLQSFRTCLLFISSELFILLIRPMVTRLELFQS